MNTKIPADKNLYSIGALSQQFQENPRVIQTALDLIEAEPVFALNDVAYYFIDDERNELLRAYFATRRENTRRKDDPPTRLVRKGGEYYFEN